MTFSTAAKNFVFLITVAILLLLVDLIKWQSGGVTWSEAIWEVNQHSLSFALGVGIVLGHCFTVPRALPDTPQTSLQQQPHSPTLKD